MKKFAIAVLSLAAAFSASAQTKTVTNADLEKFRQKRLESEQKLKERYAELGITPAEIEKQNRQRRAAMEEYSDELRQRNLQAQNGIIAEANALRLQIASVDAQINYLRRQNGGYSNQTFVYSYGYAPYGFRRSRSALPQIRNLPPNMRAVQEYAAMYPGSQSLYNQSIGNVRFGVRFDYGRRDDYRGGAFAPVIVVGGYGANDAGARLVYLEQTRAGLLVQWSILEEKARRAGIRID